MKILVLNCGSSSVKCQLVETSPEQMARAADRRLARVTVDKIGAEESLVVYEAAGEPPVRLGRSIPGHREAVEAAVGMLAGKEEIEAVGHRMVHGGGHFAHSALVDDGVISRIEEASHLAPLHNPANLKGYFAARAVLPRAAHVAVFDTAFHHSIPPRAYTYGLPSGLARRYKIRRYGFHGISHRYVAGRFAELRGSTPEKFKLITCHLGNGCSITAVDCGRSADTSLGFTPLEGLLMGTRSGDIDPAAVLYLMEQENLSPRDAGHLLNRQSGLLGISGVASDMRTLLECRRAGHPDASLAIDVFCYRVKKYIGAFFAVLDGCDAVIFTGGIGENSPEIRSGICESLGALGIRLDRQRNEAGAGLERRISADGAVPEVWVIPTNEELLIARDALRCILAARQRGLSEE